jgi:hypothetical protein
VAGEVARNSGEPSYAFDQRRAVGALYALRLQHAGPAERPEHRSRSDAGRIEPGAHRTGAAKALVGDERHADLGPDPFLVEEHDRAVGLRLQIAVAKRQHRVRDKSTLNVDLRCGGLPFVRAMPATMSRTAFFAVGESQLLAFEATAQSPARLA